MKNISKLLEVGKWVDEWKRLKCSGLQWECWEQSPGVGSGTSDSQAG